MGFLATLFGTAPDPKEAVRPLWHAVVSEARDPAWYRDCGAADTMEGRFDMITTITALVILRLDKGEEISSASALLTSLFAEDMEGQLRETGLGDPTLGKKMSLLMQSLAGRIGALRSAIPAGLIETSAAVERNVRLREGASNELMAQRMIDYAAHLACLSDEAVEAGKIGGWNAA